MTPTTDTQRAMYQAILDDPYDDTLRLAYADLVEETSTDAAGYAAFIRASVRLSVAIRDGTDDRPEAYADYEIVRTWVANPDMYPSAGGVSVWFSRGFVDTITTTTVRLRDLAASLFDAHPITCVRLRDVLVRETSTHRFVLERTDPRRAIPTILRRYLRGLGADGAYPSYLEARTALSAACVAYGRQKANLLPLPPRN